MSLAPNSIMINTNNNEFYYYYFQSQSGQDNIKKIVSRNAMPKFNKTSFRQLDIPIVDDIKSKNIVNCFNNMKNLINLISAEIEARKKQYEYYRNKLLSFEGVSCE
jgi:type I restriction enzyme S subunit